MKKILFIFFIFIAGGTMKSLSQPWAISGASWYYDFNNIFPPITGYIHIQKTGDSLVSSKTCDKLQVFYKWWNYMYNAYDSSSTYEFTYLDSNKVNYYSKFDSTFYILYDFNAIPTNTWNVYSNCIPPNDMTDTISVDSIGSTIINGDTLKHLWTSCTNPNGYQFWDKVVERIGGMGYMFPWPNCFLDFPYPPSLRCYSDSTGWSYQTIAPCNYIYTSINEPKFSNFLSLSPNPATNQITIDSKQYTKGEIQVFDVMGKMVIGEQLSVSGKTEIDISFLNKGVYYLKVSSSGKSAVKKFVKM